MVLNWLFLNKKTNEQIWLKTPETPFLTILLKGYFPKNLGPNSIQNFRKKTNEPIPRKLSERRTDDRTDPNSYNPSDNGWRSEMKIK